MTDTTNTEQIAQLKKQVLDLQLAGMRKEIEQLAAGLTGIERRAAGKTDMEDHEKRIRLLEESSTKVNTLIWLVFGGGVLSAVNLYLLIAGR